MKWKWNIINNESNIINVCINEESNNINNIIMCINEIM